MLRYNSKEISAYGVVKHRSHTEDTSKKYYEFANLEDAAEAFDKIILGSYMHSVPKRVDRSSQGESAQTDLHNAA